jgi:hypothetical protein
MLLIPKISLELMLLIPKISLELMLLIPKISLELMLLIPKILFSKFYPQTDRPDRRLLPVSTGK